MADSVGGLERFGIEGDRRDRHLDVRIREEGEINGLPIGGAASSVRGSPRSGGVVEGLAAVVTLEAAAANMPASVVTSAAGRVGSTGVEGAIAWLTGASGTIGSAIPWGFPFPVTSGKNVLGSWIPVSRVVAVSYW